tara:strand:- start:3187 stop:3405 length:219 start_codon:yes stop_codon:yes gene_type:complete
MDSYYNMLCAKAKEVDVTLLQVFIKAGIPTSTYYRTLAGSELRYATAKKAWRMLQLLDGAFPNLDKKKLSKK